MDARQLLESVSATYCNLKTLEARGTAITENREDGFSHSEQPVTFKYAAPDKVRLERGRRGDTFVCDGRDLHVYLAAPKRYSKRPVGVPHQMEGSFNPESPYSSNHTSFLFHRITERVADATILRRETLRSDSADMPCDVISVTYEPSPTRPLAVTGSPFTFWVDADSRLILRVEFEMTIDFPNHGPRTTHHVLLLHHVAIGQPVAVGTFEFTPPPDAEVMPRGNFNRGGGWVGGLGEGSQGMQWHHSHDWSHGTFVEQSRYLFRGREVTFEHRWTLSEDETEIRVGEKIEGPKGTMERTYSIPVA